MVRTEDLVFGEVVINEEYVQRLVANWNADTVGPIHAVKRRDGTYLVTDGVHRALAAIEAGAEGVKVIRDA